MKSFTTAANRAINSYKEVKYRNYHPVIETDSFVVHCTELNTLCRALILNMCLQASH